jgi:hypothetical protein
MVISLIAVLDNPFRGDVSVGPNAFHETYETLMCRKKRRFERPPSFAAGADGAADVVARVSDGGEGAERFAAPRHAGEWHRGGVAAATTALLAHYPRRLRPRLNVNSSLKTAGQVKQLHRLRCQIDLLGPFRLPWLPASSRR